MGYQESCVSICAAQGIYEKQNWCMSIGVTKIVDDTNFFKNSQKLTWLKELKRILINLKNAGKKSVLKIANYGTWGITILAIHAPQWP